MEVSSSTKTVVIIVFLLYTIALLVVGYFYKKKLDAQKDKYVENFYTGGRARPDADEPDGPGRDRQEGSHRFPTLRCLYSWSFPAYVPTLCIRRAGWGKRAISKWIL